MIFMNIKQVRKGNQLYKKNKTINYKIDDD